MVSIRRRKLLGLCSGKNSSLAPLPRFSDYGTVPGIPTHNMKPVCVHPMPSIETNQQPAAAAVRDGQQSSDISGSSASTELQNQQFSGLLLHGGEIKRRKRQQRKHFENQEACLMRGVYFKNMKWQAAIKVDKKQIHLGTVGSQEEAAHLYDRAAFMCGREPNFELSEEEKHELRQFKWDEFLAVTRLTITNKKHRRRVGAGLLKRSESLPQNIPWEGDQGAVGISASEDVKQDTSTPQF